MTTSVSAFAFQFTDSLVRSLRGRIMSWLTVLPAATFTGTRILFESSPARNAGVSALAPGGHTAPSRSITIVPSPAGRRWRKLPSALTGVFGKPSPTVAAPRTGVPSS